jgi:formylglycine-generating enzyme required for sulfatase activity
MKQYLALILIVASFGRLLGGDQATAVATLTAGFVTGITVTSGGSGYTSEPAVSLSGGGGSGAIGKAILDGDKVAFILVLTAGSGYTTAPSVSIEAPPKPLGVRLRLVPELTVEGPPGSLARVESASNLNGPWTTWTNVAVGAEGTVLVDLSAGSSTRFYRSVADPRPVVPAGMAWIPGGPFQMGDGRVTGPVRTVTVSAFVMDQWEVSIELWQSVQAWGKTRGYDLVAGGSFGARHPVYGVNWYDVVKWCNARSEKEGKVPAYYLDGAMTQVYRSGEKVPAGFKRDAGYRLPTEGEWEKAARGGVEGKSYPWGTDELNATLANYYLSNKNGTMPIGSYEANGYGLFDMAGNVWEWCWDWHGVYEQTAQTDPSGPGSGSSRVFRGGGWYDVAGDCQVWFRFRSLPDNRIGSFGFRSVLPPGQP